jgi:hypothetical protein
VQVGRVAVGAPPQTLAGQAVPQVAGTEFLPINVGERSVHGLDQLVALAPEELPRAFIDGPAQRLVV